MARQMKDSGVEWIGEIPETWNTISFWQATERMATGLNPRDNFELTSDDEYYYVTIRNFKDGKLYLDDNCDRISAAAWNIIQERSKLQVGDILFASISKDGQAYIVDTPPVNWNINESVFVIRVNPEFYTPKYFYYHLTDDAYYADLRMDATGSTFQSIKQNKLSKSRLVLPSLHEQQRIAAFLDRRCAEIDAVIERTKATIEEYKKLKQAVITEAVTKGVRGERKMKDSGIEWIGEIPEGWDIVKLKYFLSDDKVNLRVGPFGSALAGSDFVEEGEWVYNQRVVLDDNFISNDTFVSASKYAELVGFEVIPDDVLITTRGSIGKVAIVPQDAPRGILHPCIIKFRVNQDMIPHSILKHVFNDTDFVLRQIKEMSNSTTIDVLYSYSLRNVLLPLIPMCEQPEIAAYLDEKCAALDTLIAKNTALLTELETYKKSLIYEYVTGKKEVQ